MNRQRKRNSNGELTNGSRNIQSGVIRSLCECRIDNFSFRTEKTGEGITTPMNVVGKRNNGAEWCLRVYPNGYDEESSGYVGAFLTLLKPNRAKVRARFYILTQNTEVKNVSVVNEVIDLKGNSSCGCPRFVKKDFLHSRSNGLLSNDVLTIVCEAEITELKSENCGSPEVSVKIPKSQSELSSDFGSSFDSHLLTDCILKVEDTEIRVHKAVLAAQSSTFCNIFNSTSENSQMNTIEIKDFRVEVVKGMLEYIYKDKISNVRNMAGEMLAIAAEYGLDRLKKFVAKCLCDDLTVENVCERLILSEKSSSKELEECCQKFIIDNGKSLRGTKNIEELFKNHPSLAEGLFWKSLNKIYPQLQITVP